MKKRISVSLLLFAFAFSIYMCFAVTAGASGSFTNTANWTNNVTVGTVQTTNEGLRFSSEEGTRFYSNENDKSMYFFQTYSEKIVWGEMNYSLRIDEMTSATGAVALVFDFDGTMPNNPLVYLDKNENEQLAKGQTMMLVLRKGAAEGDYTLTIVHCADNTFWLEGENGTFNSEKYAIEAEGGVFNFSCDAAYDIICNGTRIQAQPYFQPGACNIEATETDEVVVSVIGFDTTAKNYEQSLAITVSESELATKLAAPTVSVTEADDGFTVSWEAVPNASLYNLYLYNAAGEPVEGFNGIAFTSGSAIEKSALQNGAYTVRVCAVGDGTKYLNSDLSAAVPLVYGVEIQKLTAPTISSVEEKAFEYIINWEAVPQASGYKCYLYNGAGAVVNSFNGIPIEIGGGIDKAALEAGEYTVKIAAVGDGVNYLDSDQSAAASFTYEIPTGWQKETAAGSMQATADGVQFSSDEGTYFYEAWKDWYSLYFIYGNADAMTWGDVDVYLRIDELTSSTGAVGLAFDFARTGVYNPQNIHHGASADFDSPGNTMVFSFIKTEEAGVYTFYIAHQSPDAGLSKIGENGNMGVSRGTVTATDGVIHFKVSAASAYDVQVNGTNYQVEDLFKPAAGNIDNAALTDQVFMSVIGFDYTENVYDESIACTLLDEAPAPDIDEDWRHNNTAGSIVETDDVNTVTVSGKESDETMDVHTDGGRQMFPDETDRILFSYTQTIAKQYAELEIDVSIDEINNKSSKVMIVVNLADSLPEGITAAQGLAIVIVPAETENKYDVYVYRIIDRIVWEEPRESYDLSCTDGKFSFTLGGNSVMIFADNTETTSDISGLITLANNNLDLTKDAYVSVVGLDDVQAAAADLAATVTVKEAGEDEYIDDATDATVTGKYEFTSTDWASWEMAGTNVSYTITENGLRLEGNGGDYGQKQAQSYLYDLKQQITGENGYLKIGMKIENFYPYITDEDTGVLIKNTFDIILGTAYQTNFTSCRSLFIRLNFKSATEGTASLIYNTGTTEDTVEGWGDINFTWSKDEPIIIYLVKDAEGNYRVYVNGVKFAMSKSQTAEMKSLVESMPEIFLSTYSTIEIEQDPNDTLKGDDSAYTSVYSIYSLNGNKVVNEVAELTNVAAPSKPQDEDITKNSIKISWNAPTLNPFDNGSFTVGGYVIERYDLNSKGSNKDGVPDEVYYLTDVSDLSLEVTGLTEATKYFFTIYAVVDASAGDAGRDDMVVLAKYAQFTVTTDGEPATEDPTEPAPDETTGCSSSITVSGLVAGVALIGAAAVLLRKNKQN